MNTNEPEHAPRCADCNVTMEYDDDRDDEGNLLNAWWHCPSCLRNESFCHATDAPPAPTAPAETTDGPTGALYGFVPKRVGNTIVTTGDAPVAEQDPPWAVAAREIGDTLALRYSDTFTRLWTDIVRRAAEAHAAALAQERDGLKAKLESLDFGPPVSEQDINEMAATRDALRAERDRLVAALREARDYLAANKRESNHALLARIDAALAPTQKEEA